MRSRRVELIKYYVVKKTGAKKTGSRGQDEGRSLIILRCRRTELTKHTEANKSGAH
jgi:hypothetical protein